VASLLATAGLNSSAESSIGRCCQRSSKFSDLSQREPCPLLPNKAICLEGSSGKAVSSTCSWRLSSVIVQVIVARDRCSNTAYHVLHGCACTAPRPLKFDS
ncbi:unnamed protein product, partial [Ectocarpus sp. 12 AP-2014]